MAFFLKVTAEWFVGRGRAVQVRGCESPLRVLFSVLERAGQTDTHIHRQNSRGKERQEDRV